MIRHFAVAVNHQKQYKSIIIILTVIISAFLTPGHARVEPVPACIIPADASLNPLIRDRIAQCLGWSDTTSGICLGAYSARTIPPVNDREAVHVQADRVTFYNTAEPSLLEGSVRVQQDMRIAEANTAYIYRNPQTNTIEKIVLVDNVRLMEPDRFIIASKALVHPKDGSGRLDDVLYRLDEKRSNALLPAWGRALSLQRFPNKDFVLEKATYTTCAPTDKAWEIRANKIDIYDADHVGVARDAVLRVRDTPIFYTPYFSFPTNKDRKSGFLTPVPGYSREGGFDIALPYYWNMAPNYDMTLTPHGFTSRGVMMSGLFRYLFPDSQGMFEGNFLPQDRGYERFLQTYSERFPELAYQSNNRWSILAVQHAAFTPNLWMDLSYQQVSDDYYFQDFSTNLAVATERQLLRQLDLNYTTDNWVFRAMAQGYQTLNPVNESLLANIYRRLPQLLAQGNYTDLPWNSRFQILGEYDQFFWPDSKELLPDGPRVHINPAYALPIVNRSWGFLTPSAEWVGNFYDVKQHNPLLESNYHVNHNLGRVSVDSGLYFDRFTSYFGESYRQTLEPRVFYLYVPYQNQSNVPAYDSANMIFSFDQIYRTNRFSGLDRIGDANQLAYGFSTRWFSEKTGMERAAISVGQIRYFSDRKVQLCYSPDGICFDSPQTLGYLSPTEDWSPIAARGLYQFSSVWSATANYVWDPAIRGTNNAQFNLHFQPDERRVIQLGYTWLVNGDDTRVIGNLVQYDALNQASLAFAWPLTERWSSLGAYGYNISKGYTMMSLLGLQYDNCCWAMRIMGGQTFNSINPQNRPEYNNNVYLQIMFKGLGSLATTDPSRVIQTWIPGYRDPFAR